MSTSTAAPRTFDVRGTSRVPFGRLVGVELRKMADTRAGAWLLAIIALVTLAVMAVFLFNVEQDERTFYGLLSVTASPQMLLLPVLAILLVTSEWGQRTTLTTFSLEPSRLRVVLAKVAAALVFGLAAIVFAAVVAAVVAALGGAPEPWDPSPGTALGHFFVLQLTSVLMGVAFGLLFLNSAAAIVLFFVIPIAFSTVATFWSWLADHAAWVDIGNAQSPFFESSAVSGEQWTQLAVTSFIWIVVPFVLGTVRVLRSEVK